MNIIKCIDEKLMRLLTYRWQRYRGWENRHQMNFPMNFPTLILSTLIPTLFTIAVIASGFSPLNIMGVLYWLVAFYEWRLWFRWRQIRAGSDK